MTKRRRASTRKSPYLRKPGVPFTTTARYPDGRFNEEEGDTSLRRRPSFNFKKRLAASAQDYPQRNISLVVTPSESSVMRRVALEPLFLNHLRKNVGISGIRQVIMHEVLSNLRPLIFLQFANDTPRTEVWRGLQAASSRIADCGKIVIAVSEDVDPANANAIFWSMAYRSNPIEDVQVLPYRSPGNGPTSDRKSGAPSDPRSANSTLLIDATLKHVMPPIALPAQPYITPVRSLEG